MMERKMLKMLLFGICAIVLVGTAYAETGDPMPPNVAAKAERSKRQQAERITSAQRRAAAEALKTQRKKLHDARNGMLQPVQDTVDVNPKQSWQGNGHE